MKRPDCVAHADLQWGPGNITHMNKRDRTLSVKNAGIVLSDIDGTIVRGSLVLEHACEIHKKGIVDLGDIPEQWNADRKNEKLIGALGEAYRGAIVGMTPDDIEASDFIKSYVADQSRFYSTINKLIEAKKNGYRVVLISGSPNFLVTPFARKFGFRSKGSNYKRDEGGRFTGECLGMFNADSKRRHVASLKTHTYSHTVAYGDTASDLPLFEVADHSVLVAPTPATRSATDGLVHRIISD